MLFGFPIYQIRVKNRIREFRAPIGARFCKPTFKAKTPPPQTMWSERKKISLEENISPNKMSSQTQLISCLSSSRDKPIQYNKNKSHLYKAFLFVLKNAPTCFSSYFPPTVSYKYFRKRVYFFAFFCIA